MKVHHIALRTAEVERLVRFYTTVLGFEAVRTTPRSVWLGAGGAVLMIELREDGEPDVPRGAMELVAFAIDDESLAPWAQRLAAAGVSVEGATAHTLYFRDPDGRRVGLSRYPLSQSK